MKKRFILMAAGLCMMTTAVLAGYNYYEQSQIDPLILENMEAMTADDNPVTEIGGDSYVCENTITEEKNSKVFYCAICNWVNDSKDAFWSSTKNCVKK